MTTALLSRVAESIFWIGRYVERAEGTARILDVVVHHTLEERGAASAGAAGRLLAVMGLPAPDGPPDLWEVTESLAHQPASRSSIAGAINGARDNARAVRHVLPVEVWEKINATWVDLQAEWDLARRAGPSTYLTYVKNQIAAIVGFADTTMSRDETWLFFTLGRSLERTDVVARQLASLPLEDLTETGLVTLLRSCGAYEPYLRLTHGVVTVDAVVDFLLRDRLFPRSAFASLVTSESCLDHIGGTLSAWDEARGLVGLARAQLEFSAPGLLLHDLDLRLEGLQMTCSAASDAVTRRYFTHEGPTEWHRRVSW
ncbi:MAG TPA: alpha-E domain-containing protein [Acidimicrobiales bacterium]|nr:alpha-E domain-containing protein [Acidimicrobiales bacterium]